MVRNCWGSQSTLRKKQRKHPTQRIHGTGTFTYIFHVNHLNVWKHAFCMGKNTTSKVPRRRVPEACGLSRSKADWANWLGGEISNMFYLHPENWGNDGKWSNLNDIFQMGWNHQLVVFFDSKKSLMKHGSSEKHVGVGVAWSINWTSRLRVNILFF